MKPSVGLFLFMIGISSVACTAGTSRDEIADRDGSVPIAVEALYSSTKCGHLDPGVNVTLISNREQLASAYKGFRKDVLGAAPIALPNVDFKHDVVVLVEMGQRPTLGYRLALKKDVPAQAVAQHAEITLEWIEPGGDMMVGEMLTSPCLLLKLARGPYGEVWVKDQFGVKKSVLALPR